MMPVSYCSRRCKTGNPRGMHQDGQPVGSKFLQGCRRVLSFRSSLDSQKTAILACCNHREESLLRFHWPFWPCPPHPPAGLKSLSVCLNPRHVFSLATFIIAMTAIAKRNSTMGRADLATGETEQDTLIQEAKEDRAAFAELYRLHYELVFRYCSRRLFNRHAAEDVTSTVFLKVMRNLRSFEGDARGFRNWLYSIATNAINDHLRTKARRADAIRMVARELGCSASPESNTDLQEIHVALKQAVLALQPKYQTVITLRFFEKMRLIEIAEVLNQNPATIRSQLSRALKRLRKELRAVGHLGL